MDYKLKKYAKLLLEHAVHIKVGEKIIIKGELATISLIRAVYQIALEKGAYPEIQLVDSYTDELLFKHGNDEQLKYFPDHLIKGVEDTNVILSLIGDTNTKMYHNISDKKINLALEGYYQYSKTISDQLRTNRLRFVEVICPTEANAQASNMSYYDYEQLIYDAAFVNLEKPAKKWLEISREQERLIKVLNSKRKFKISSTNTDLLIGLEGRKWSSCSGKKVFPGGDLKVAPVEDSISGHIKFDYPAYYKHNRIDGIKLTFENGMVVEASASGGQSYLEEFLAVDKGARRIGGLTFGTNTNIKSYTGNELFDDKMSGSLKVTLGHSVENCGGQNRSAAALDLRTSLSTSSSIYSDGRLIYSNGRFLI